MKKYLTICFSVLFIIFSVYFIYFYTPFTLFVHKDVNTFVKVSGKNILLNNNNFNIRSINISSFIPGNNEFSNKDKEETYLRWFNQIKDLNLNTIRVMTIEDPIFYKALLKYNENNDNPLYLIQGIDAGDYEKNSSVDYFDASLKKQLISDSKIMVDVIHGKRMIADSKRFPYGKYIYDVSKWTIAYVLGNDWNADTVLYTNNNNPDNTTYEGEYLKTSPNSKPFERVLAEVGDKLFKYESQKYGTQRLVSFNNTWETDPLEYEQVITEYFNKVASFDMNNIQATNKVKSGLFASFVAYSNYPNLYQYSSTNYSDTYYEYLRNLNIHYNTPLFISEFGYSTSRSGSSSLDTSNLTYNEVDQGKMILNAINTMKSVGINSYSINQWQDNWSNNIWNTMYAVDTARSKYWHNVQTFNQGYGLLLFKSEENNRVILDGKTTEWSKENIVASDNNITLSAKYDQEYLYLLIQKPNLNLENDTIYIPIDTIDTLGSKIYANDSLNFSKNADFLIKINGKDNSKVMVQERYDLIRAIFGERIYFFNPLEKEHIPNKNSNIFNDIYLVGATQSLVRDNLDYTIENKASLINTGKLVYGNTNPNNYNYNSLSDFYSDNNVIEVRIAWQLLNFADPVDMKISDDYYENYGVEFKSIDKISLGIGDGTKIINLEDFDLEKWNQDISYEERLKKSYQIIAEGLKGED